jgi:hypothetical protein
VTDPHDEPAGDAARRAATLGPERGELDPTDALGAFLLEAMHQACTPQDPDGHVLAHTIDQSGGTLLVRGVLAGTPRRPGAVAAWLDQLPTDRAVLVAAVVSDRLAGMLARRGFRQHIWFDAAVDQFDTFAMYRSATP